LGFPGRNSTALSIVSFSIGTGITWQRYTSGPLAGTEKGVSIFNTMSGSPNCQPSENTGGFGKSLGSPSGALAAAHLPSIAISASVSRRSS
jgi:hypothetical protein